MMQKRMNAFEQIHLLTIQELGDGVDLPAFGRQRIEKWEELFKFWQHHLSSSGGDGILYPVLHKVHWGVYPDAEKSPFTPESYSETHLEIFRILEETLRYDKTECKYVMSSAYFRHELQMLREMKASGTKDGAFCYSRSHAAYLSVMFEKEVNGGRGTPYKANIDIPYEKLVLRLLPEAAVWERAEWQTDEAIFKGLVKTYGIDYFVGDTTYAGEDFDALINTLELEWIKRAADSSHMAIHIRTLSMELAKLIWPKLEKKIAQLFLSAVKLVREKELPQEVLVKSWLYKQINEWINSDDWNTIVPLMGKKTAQEVRTECFNLALGIQL